jgi:lysozyme
LNFGESRYAFAAMKLLVTVVILFGQSVAGFAISNTVVNMSHYDMMNPNFVRMHDEGVIGLIHEASYPRYERDSKYGYRQNAALRAGLLWGAYHFADATDPVRQADHFLSVVGGAWHAASPPSGTPGVLLVLDFEQNGHYPGGTMRIDQAVRFAERIHERTGIYPGFYSGEYRIRQFVGGSRAGSALRNCWLWVANYHFEPRSVRPWSRWDMWQYTGDGKCDLRPRSSFPTTVANVRQAERNMFRGSAVDLKAFWQQNAWLPK